jgi:hypothetical protein
MTSDHSDESPREVARKDWSEGRATAKVLGTLASDRPLVDEELGLYVTSLGCEVTSEARSYANEYNQELARLVAKHGPPDWGVTRRRPSRDRALVLLDGAPLLDQVLSEGLLEWSERRALRDGLAQMTRQQGGVTWQPKTCQVDRSTSICVIGGDFGARAGIINVFDFAMSRWMVTYQLRRRHRPLLPWDNT